MNIRKISLFVCSIALILLTTSCSEQKQNAPLPNIIFILTDDLGYGDLGVLHQNQRKNEGKPYHQTPHLDKMAEEGILLTRHYVPAPVCAPSRASLLTGVHQGHAEIRNNQFDKALPDNHNIASVLKEAGYATAIIGKYGLQGKEGTDPESWEAYPTKRGFDYFFGYVRHGDGHNHYPAHNVAERSPKELYSGNDEISAQLKGCYTTDLFTAMTKKWIVEHRNENSGQPFFLYLAYDTPHAGMEVASTPYPIGGGLNGGVQWIGESDNFINTVTDSIDTYIHPDYQNRSWPMVQQRFASMVRRIDNGVGDIFHLLKDLNIDENTLVVFTSDNGPHAESYGYGEYAPTLFESYGEFDGIKRDTWEGGIRVPAIVRWPGNIPSHSEDDTPTGFHDWLPTFTKMANLPAPANTDGISLLPLLTKKGQRKEGTVYIEYSVYGETPSYEAFHHSHSGQKRGEMQVIFHDGYKGVRYNINSHSDDFRIYDTKKDPQEVTNLASTNEYFNILQKSMKAKVLRVRIPNAEAPRPYDSEPVPAIDISGNLKNGIRYKLYHIKTPWVPDVKTLNQNPAESGIIQKINLEPWKQQSDMVIAFEGLLNVPKTGKFNFTLNTEGNIVVHIHNAMVFDADKGYCHETSTGKDIWLEKGYHPIKIVYRRKSEREPFLEVQWSGPDFKRRNIDSTDIYYVTQK
jgi:arylsulfatase A-like enzyme